MPDYRDTVFLPRTDFPMKAGLAQKEPAILKRWQDEDLYGELRRTRAGAERFILHDGPPYANGDIHMGHAMNKVLKDLIVRSQSLLGKDAPYVPGWDCHGLPIEWKVEEQYRKKKLNKDEVPTDQFRAECRAYAEHWVGVQRAQFERLGVMGDWDDPYLTMKYEAEAAIAAELLKFASSGQVYRGAKPVMWSPVEKTALAEAEVEYEDITSTQIDVAFEIVESPIPELVGAHAVVWTTTPWTIPVNQAIAYGPEVNYILQTYFVANEADIETGGRTNLDPQNARAVKLLIAEDLLNATASRANGAIDEIGDWPLSDEELDGYGFELRSIKGSDLAGTVARHPMHHLGGFFARPRPFLPGEFVTTDQGTGLVHMAPDHGEDDFALCKAHGLEPVFAVEDDGRYRENWAWLPGQGSVINPKFNAPDGPICSDLRDTGALLAASADYKHSYPHSWRSKAKLIFRATPQWFIAMDKPFSSPLVGEDQGGGSAASAAEKTLSAADAADPHPSPSPQGGGVTLRSLALRAIDDTRWVPGKSKNRIQAMVEGRPDWVISRQRAWGVPIPLYVHRRTGELLHDETVNARVLDAFREGGADAWFTADHQALLGPEHSLADYEPQRDILDVWFDSGSTHAYVVEARYGEGTRADIYVEGSDQHRGWFQSSLLESCGTRGRAPYGAVLTHGFALDDKGRKMSKSLGNVVDPLKVIETSGADILRLWAASTDYFEDVRIGKDALSGATDGYRKLRNSFRYLLGALDGWSEEERLAPADMPELERYTLHLLARLDAALRDAVEAFEFGRYTRALLDFCNEDLSAFVFDIRKDSLYCDAPASTTRQAYRTVLDTLFAALVRYAAPLIPFTAEEVWGTRHPDGGSVHLLVWPEVTQSWRDEALAERWTKLRAIRGGVTEAIEPMRRDKTVGSSLEATVQLALEDHLARLLEPETAAELFISSDVSFRTPEPGVEMICVGRTNHAKCGRCWRHRPEVEPEVELCGRCRDVVGREVAHG